MADATTRYSFPYQETTDAPNGPALGQDLAEAVETSLGSVDDRLDTAEDVTTPAAAAWTTYTPTFTTGGGGGAAGTGGGGNLTGRHKKVGRVCTVSGYLKFGTTGPSAGSGEWRFALPFTAATVTDVAWMGTVYIGDASGGSTAHLTGTVQVLSGATYLTLYAGNAGQQVTSTAPIPWTSADFCRWQVTYETAA